MPAILFMDFAHNNWQAFRSKAQWSAVGQFRIGIGNQKSEWYGMAWYGNWVTDGNQNRNRMGSGSGIAGSLTPGQLNCSVFRGYKKHH